MRAFVAFGVVLFAAQGLWVPAWASPAGMEGQASVPITSAQPAVHSPAAARTEPPLLAVAYTAPSAAPLPATGPAAGQPTTTLRQDASTDGTDSSDMAMMLLVALAMLTTLVFKGSRS